MADFGLAMEHAVQAMAVYACGVAILVLIAHLFGEAIERMLED